MHTRVLVIGQHSCNLFYGQGFNFIKVQDKVKYTISPGNMTIDNNLSCLLCLWWLFICCNSVLTFVPLIAKTWGRNHGIIPRWQKWTESGKLTDKWEAHFHLQHIFSASCFMNKFHGSCCIWSRYPFDPLHSITRIAKNAKQSVHFTPARIYILAH